MAGGREEFERQLVELGYELDARSDKRTSFPYEIKGGSFAGRLIRLGFAVPETFPREIPHGPHFTPRLQPINPSVPTHPNRVHQSEFGPEWQHWSRPYHGWRGTETVATYMAFIDRLFDTA